MKLTQSGDHSSLPKPETRKGRDTNTRKPPRRRRSVGPSTPRVALSDRRRSSSSRRRKEGGPPTPAPVRWKVEEDKEEEGEVRERKGRRREGVSVRRLGAALWRLQSPEEDGEVGGGGGERRGVGAEVEGRLGFQSRVGQGGDRLSCHHESRRGGCPEAEDLARSPRSVNGPTDRYLRESSLQFSVMEGATKWDPVSVKASTGNLGNLHFVDSKQKPASAASSLQAELDKAHRRIEELETERKASKKKVDQFLKKLSEERAAWRSKEHEKVRAFINDTRAELKREKKSRQRLEIINAKLVDDLAEAKQAAKRYLQEYEKERKARELVEEVCDELAKEIGEDKAEAEALKKECTRIQEEVEEERKMLQMAEVWREERVQMKLVDAKATLHEKFTQMNKLIQELESFLRTRGWSSDLKEVKELEMFRQAAASIKVQDLKEFRYEPPNPDDILSVFEEMVMGEQKERDIEPCVAHSPKSTRSKIHTKIHTVSPELQKDRSQRPIISYASQNEDLDDDRSGWETVSGGDDQGSSYSPDGSIPSAHRTQRDSNASGSCTDWEINLHDGAPITEIGEVISTAVKQSKKVSSISRLWRSCPDNGVEKYKIVSTDGTNGRISNGRISNASIMSSDNGYIEGGLSPSDVAAKWSPPDSTGTKVGRGKKGCIEWPLAMQKSSIKHKLLEAKMESQKIQLRHVLKQKI